MALPNLLLPFLIASALSLHGLRRRSLSPTGALTAFLVGFLTFSPPLRTFGWSLIAFYLIGSRATKLGAHLKRTLESGYEDGGYRSGAQVLCNSAAALVAAVLWADAFAPGYLGQGWRTWREGALPRLRPAGPACDPRVWCPLSPDIGVGFSRMCLYGALGHFACCLGDTLASELGILSKSPPRLITTFKPVPPGTNGGMSTMGTLASLAGGLIMGLTTFLCLILESSACRSQWSTWLLELAVYGTLAGGLGSLLDSFMGATIQRTRYSNTTKMILSDESTRDESESDVKVISGIGILTNNQVNLVSSLLTAYTLAMLA